MNWQSHFHKDITSLQIIFLIKSEQNFFVETEKLFLKFTLIKKETICQDRMKE